MSRGRHAVKCFLSPIDALIEASILAKSGDSCEVAAVAAIDRDAILTGPGKRLVACVHQAWIAQEDQILLRPNSLPVSEAQLVTEQTWGSLLCFTPDTSTLETLDCVHQAAGLFAWRETIQDIARWDTARLRETAQFALRTMPIGRVHTEKGSEAKQYALFDPEFRQWHFIPCR